MVDPEPAFNMILNNIFRISKSATSKNEKLKQICQTLHDRVSYYDWVGFYIADPEKKVLKLGPYVGAETEHVEIPYGKGICGQAAETLVTFVIQDVSKEDNYLSCSPIVKSEIVIPIMKADEFIGELDIDSYKVNAFTNEDKNFLQNISNIVVQIF
jgi:GAF domain-containing protein